MIKCFKCEREFEDMNAYNHHYCMLPEIVCSWCGLKYRGSPLTHVCPDGKTIHERASQDIPVRQPEKKELTTGTFYDRLKLTPKDVKWLKGIKVKIDDTDQLVDEPRS